MIEFFDISKSYGKQKIFDHFNLAIESGEFICIVGMSGSGKTTLMRMINGMVKPDSGTILINQQPLSQLPIYSTRQNIGYAIQSVALFPHLSVYHNIAYVPLLAKKPFTEEDAKKLLDLVSLDSELLKRYPHQLSGGQKQRIGIARALANDPPILLLDEPFGAVDAITRKTLQQELKQIHQKLKKTVVFITHDMHEAIHLATKIVVLNKGHIEQYDTPENLKNNPKTDYVKLLLEVSQL